MMQLTHFLYKYNEFKHTLKTWLPLPISVKSKVTINLF